MPRRLSIIQDTFELSGRRGAVVALGIPREGDWRIKVGDPLLLRRPDGTTLRSSVVGIEMHSPPHPTAIPLLVGPDLTKSELPIGTEIWID